MKDRYPILFSLTALTLALMALFALSLPAPPAVTVLSQAPAQETGADWELRSIEGEICILQGEEVYHTGWQDSLLPSRDRAALAQGIHIGSREELAALLEDLAS